MLIKQKINKNIKMKQQENKIYSKIDYENAFSAKKDILNAQLDLLNTIQIIEDYRILRKQEMMLKLKLKNDIRKTKENISAIIEKAPKTKSINETLVKNKEKSKMKKGKKYNGLTNVESELEEIHEKLKKMD